MRALGGRASYATAFDEFVALGCWYPEYLDSAISPTLDAGVIHRDAWGSDDLMLIERTTDVLIAFLRSRGGLESREEAFNELVLYRGWGAAEFDRVIREARRAGAIDQACDAPDLEMLKPLNGHRPAGQPGDKPSIGGGGEDDRR